MKTLKEEVYEVVIGKGSINKKREALIKLGLQRYECKLILDAWLKDNSPAPRTRTPRTPKFTFKFGVELEMLCNRFAVTRGLRDNNVAFNYIGYYTHTNNNTAFEFKSDSSIHRNSYTTPENDTAIECVSPVLDGRDGMKQIETCCKVLEETNAQVNRSTGFHVHISTANMTNEWFSNVFVNYMHLERLIDTFMALSRRGNNNAYCCSLIRRGLDNCHSISEVSHALGHCRYFKVNSEAFASHGTIEFRQHHGTVNYEKIKNWVNFCAKLIAWSKDNRLTEDVNSLADVKFLTATERDFYQARINSFANNH